MVNIQHVTLTDTTQPVKLYISIGTESGLSQNGHDLMDCNSLGLQQRMSHLLYLKKFI